MPLVRFQVRNEFSLGQPQLYKEANREDPKAVLDGVTVAGLVGILRQLGDLAEFAAEVFHGLQEQVTTTASRSHKLMVRVQHIEAALPPLEKAVLAQTGHIHFAYTAGLEWHPRIRNERNHFVYNDLPRFIMDSYEECQDPPRLHLLDKFDTGGPGSCLKRYSDPTFFKRASAIPDDANAEKVQRDRKAQRSKKKRGSHLNGDVSHCVSISNHSSRMQPISIVNGRSSPSQTASTSDMALKSDTGNNSNSFDSRTGSGYIDFVAHSSSSMQAKQQEYRESPTTESVQHGGTLESVLPDCHTGSIDGDSPGSTLQDQVTSGSSCGNWDEKAEIVDPNGHQHCIDETTEILPTKDHLDKHERASGNNITIEQMEFLFDGENILESTSSRNRIDEIDSEPDDFMDALNTIESEPENDLDCQTKREVEHFASVVNRKGLDGLHEITMDCSDRHTETSSISPEREGSVDLPNSATLESPVHEQMLHIAMEPSNSDHSLDFDRTDILDSSRLEIVDNPDHQTPRFETHTVNDELAASGSGTANVQDNSVSSLCESQNSHADLTRNNSINFWTNGGLLGLEPSKPPDFSMASPVNPAGGSTCETVGLSNHAYKLIVDEHEMERSMWTENAGCNNKDQDDGISSEKTFKGVPATELYPKLGKNGDSFMSNGFSHSMENGWKETNIMERGTLLPVGPYDKSASKGLNQEIDENSSLVFGLGRRLLENGFGRNATYTHGDTCEREPASFLNAGELEQTNKHHRAVYQSFPDAAFKQQSENGFSFDSSPSSPPLEHMKISFHPINGIETSKLKLKLCHGNQTHESARDMFQSFQLIPEPAIPLHEFGSDSDDDTFCRSSPYISDDCVSHHSELHSEHWESSGTPERDNNELYDALRGISSVEHISTSPELREMANNSIYFDDGIKFVHSENGLYSLEHSFSDSLLDLPSLNAFKPVLLPEIKDDSLPKELHGLRCPGESMPEPPPLPPVEWCVSKSDLDATEEKQDVSEGFKQVLHTELAGSIISQRPPVRQQQVNEAIFIQPKSKQEQQLNGQKEADRALNGKGIDEKDDFLQQIRTQSFNLRRTVTAKATTATPGPATNVKVTAILEKANAIRQAVGSDDGDDDDTWSDT